MDKVRKASYFSDGVGLRQDECHNIMAEHCYFKFIFLWQDSQVMVNR